MKKVRYTVVGAGWISQEAFMPGVHGAANSEMVAIVTGDMEKAKKLNGFHGIAHVFSYERYDEMLASGLVDAVYIALPNSMHADYAIRAAKAGVHALVEKPLATSIDESEAMIAAAEKAGTFLMTAYRLHNDPGTIEVLETIRRGDIGDPRLFNATFCFNLPAGNHRLKAGHWGGPLQDVGVYCINAMRHVFAAEPVEVAALSSFGDNDPRFSEVEEAWAATLKFPQGRLATFSVSFGSDALDNYTIIGTEGRIEVSQAFRFEANRIVRLIKDGKATEKAFPLMDDFAGQTAYFSDCILNGERPEADGEEGLADMRVMIAIEEAVRTGRMQPIQSPARPRHPTPDIARSISRNDRRLLI